MANLNFTLREEDWYESQPIQLSTGKFAISINFGDAANNRVVVYKSSNGKDYVPYKTALGVGEFCGVTNEKTLTGMLAVTDGKAVTAQTTADAAKSTAQTALSKATANETKLNTIPEMPENDGKIYGFCNGAWVVIAEVGKNVYTD